VVVRPFAVTNDRVPTESFAVHLGPAQLAPLVADGALSLATYPPPARSRDHGPDAAVAGANGP
jgi:hypothetical protein